MTKVTGIDIGTSHVHLVEIDGSARKFKLTRALSIPRDPMGHGLEEEVAAAFEESGADKRRCLLALPSQSSVLRNVEIPFQGRDEIVKVLKFEAESYIHSHAIDDVVVDGISVEETVDGTEVFMAAFPKAELQQYAEALAGAGAEAEVFELDLRLLVDSAKMLGLFETAEEGDEAPPRVQLLTSLGQGSIGLALTLDGELRTARSLRWGIDNLERNLAKRLGISELEARYSLAAKLGLDLPMPEMALSGASALAEEASGEAMGSSNGNGSPSPEADPGMAAEESGTEASEPVAGGSGSEAEPMSPSPEGEAPAIRKVLIADEVLREEVQRFTTHLGRELVRFVAGAKLPEDPGRVLATGGGCQVPYLLGSLEDDLETPVEKLDLVGSVAEVEAEIGESEPQLDLALAAALASLGSIPAGMNFRQEELAYRRKFDRLKGPLATMVLCAAVFLFFMCILHVKALDEVASRIGRWCDKPPFTDPVTKKKKIGKPGCAAGLLRHYVWHHESRTNHQEKSPTGRLLGTKFQKQLLGKLEATDRFDRVHALQTFLKNRENRMQKDTGYNPELKLEPGLAVWQAFAAVLTRADQEQRIDRFVVPEFELLLKPTVKSRKLKFKIAFTMTAEQSYRQQNGAFKQIVQASCEDKKSPFESYVDKELPQLEEGIYRGECEYTIQLKPSIEVFQPRR